MRSPFLVAGLNSATLETWIGRSLSTMPPVCPFIGLGRWCFFTRFTPSTTTCSASTRRITVPRLPLSRPDSTTTSSPFLIRCISKHLWGKRYDLHEALGAQLARHRPENARADRLHLRRQQHRGVAVEADERAVGAAHALGGAHHDGVVDLALLHPPARRRVLDAHLDQIADRRVAPLRAAHHLDAHDRARAGVVGDVQYRLHLNHLSFSTPTCMAAPCSLGPRPGTRILDGLGLLHKARHAPRLGPGDRPVFRDLDQVALLVLVGLGVRVDLLGQRDDLAHHRVLHAALHAHGDGFLHLVADHPADQLALVLLLSHLATFSRMTVRTRAMSRFTFFIWLVLDSCWVASCMRRPNWARSRPSSSFCSSSPFFSRSSLGFMCYPRRRCTTMVRNGSLAAASAKASLASGSRTPSISNSTLPGWISATKYSGLPLPLPMRTSAGFDDTGLSGKMRIQMRPPRLMWRDMARRAASSCRAVRRPRVVALRPYSPNDTLAPRVATPVLRPFCCLRYLVRAGCSMATPSSRRRHPWRRPSSAS